MKREIDPKDLIVDFVSNADGYADKDFGYTQIVEAVP